MRRTTCKQLPSKPKPVSHKKRRKRLVAAAMSLMTIYGGIHFTFNRRGVELSKSQHTHVTTNTDQSPEVKTILVDFKVTGTPARFADELESRLDRAGELKLTAVAYLDAARRISPFQQILQKTPLDNAYGARLHGIVHDWMAAEARRSGDINVEVAELGEAAKCYEQSLLLNDQGTPDAKLSSKVSSNLAGIWMTLGERSPSEALKQKYLRRAREVYDRMRISNPTQAAYCNGAAVYALLGDYEKAAKVLQDAATNIQLPDADREQVFNSAANLSEMWEFLLMSQAYQPVREHGGWPEFVNALRESRLRFPD